MACPACHGVLELKRTIPPGFWCGTCGTWWDVEDWQEGPKLVPQYPQRALTLIDSAGTCLRDDRGQCVVWLAEQAIRRHREETVARD